jgi:hypothetical protein
MLPFVIVWLSLIFGFSAGKIAYDKTPANPLTVSELDKVIDVATTHINIR